MDRRLGTLRRWVQRVAWTLLAVLTLAAFRVALGKSLGPWVVARERARFERDVGPLDPTHLETPPPADEENAAIAIARVAARLELDATALGLLRRASWADLSETDGHALDALLAERDLDLDALAAAASLKASSFGPRRDLFATGSLAGIAWLRAARLTASDGQRALDSGDLRRVDRDLAALYGMSVALRREPIAVFALFGVATETLYLELLRDRLGAGLAIAPSPAIERQLADLRHLPGAPAVMHGEGVYAFDMLRRQVPRAPPPRDLAERIEALVWPWSEGHVEAGAIEGWRELAGWATRPQSTWPSASEIARSRHRSWRRWIDPTVPFETVRTILVPDLLATVRKLQFLSAAEQLAELALVLARDGEKSGQLPAAAVASFPAALRRDPVAGEKPAVRRLGDGSTLVELPAAAQLARRVLVVGSPPASGGRRLAALLRWQLPPPDTDRP